MAIPNDLKRAIDNELDSVPETLLKKAAADLTNRYRNPLRDNLPVFMISKHHRLAYLAARLPATYEVVKCVLEECKRRLPLFSPKKVCDVGAGPGTATWAVFNSFPAIEEFYLYEKDREWLKIGDKLMKQSACNSFKKVQWKEADLNDDIVFEENDLIILSYLAGELKKEAMVRLIESAWKSVSEIFVVIEPGTTHGFEKIRIIRDQLIKMGAFLVAPCPHDKVCPMQGGDWCHFYKRLERSSLHKRIKEGELGYEDEKFSYLVVSKSKVKLPEARVLRHPVHHSGHLDLVLCKRDGLEKRTVSKKEKRVYKEMKKLDWGDVLEGGNHIEIHSGLGEIKNQFNAFLFDAYGVFWGGNDFGLLPGAKEVMEKLVLSGKTVGVLSNSTQLAKKEIEKLSRHGLIQGKHFHFLITSGEVAKVVFSNEELPFETPNKKFWVFGGVHPKYSSHETIFDGTAYTETFDLEKADFIFIGVPHVNGEDQTDLEVFRKDIQQLVRWQLPMVCPNPDLFAHEGDPPRLVVRQGGIASIYEEMGNNVFYIGKPYSKAFSLAMKEFGHYKILNPEEILMVGDTPETDIRGGRSFGMKSALVIQTGIMAERIQNLGSEKALNELSKMDTPDFFIERLIDGI